MPTRPAVGTHTRDWTIHQGHWESRKKHTRVFLASPHLPGGSGYGTPKARAVRRRYAGPYRLSTSH
jgi:hypothetical protein